MSFLKERFSEHPDPITAYEDEQVSRWQPVQLPAFPPESLGSMYFPLHLVGRTRPPLEDFLAIDSIAFLRSRLPEYSARKLKNESNIPLRHILQAQPDDLPILFTSMTDKLQEKTLEDIQKIVRGYLEQLLVLPHSLFLEQYFDQLPRVLLPPHIENTQRNGIDSLMRELTDTTSMKPRERFSLREKFGLNDWHPKSLQEIGIMLNRTKPVIQKLGRRADMVMKNAKAELFQFTPLHPLSVARSTNNFFLQGDITRVPNERALLFNVFSNLPPDDLVTLRDLALQIVEDDSARQIAGNCLIEAMAEVY